MIPTSAGIRRPDLVVAKGERALIVDTTVCADANAAAPNDVYDRKVHCYYKPEICDWVRREAGIQRVDVAALVFNWRGDITGKSHDLLRELRLLSEIRMMEVMLMEGSARIIKFFKQAAGR